MTIQINRKKISEQEKEKITNLLLHLASKEDE